MNDRCASSKKKCLLFDIDGTLLHTHGAGREAFEAALEHAYGVPVDISGINFAGATDLRVLDHLIEEQSLSTDRACVDLFFEVLPDILDQCFSNNPPEILQGVVNFLEKVASSHHMGLVTGNIRSTAFVKLKHAGMDHFFDEGGFGDDHRDRDQIARFALERINGDFQRIILFGDTPSDINAARANNLTSVAVCSGGFSRAQLEEAGADIVLESFRDMQQLNQILEMEL